jgi:ADP-ribosyltransferase exoenzyme
MSRPNPHMVEAGTLLAEINNAWADSLLFEIDSTFHLPGRHNQKDHGREGGRKKSGKTDLTAKRFAEARRGQDALDAAPVGTNSTTEAIDDLYEVPSAEREKAGRSLGEYRDLAYGPINRGLHAARGGPYRLADADITGYEVSDAAVEGHQSENVETLKKLMNRSRLTHDVVVERGVRNPSRSLSDPSKWNMTGGMEGAEWTDYAFSSATANPDEALFFALRSESAQPTIFAILVPKGTPAVQLSPFVGEAGDKGEAELLLPPGLRYRVVDDHGVIDGIRRLDVEVAER